MLNTDHLNPVQRNGHAPGGRFAEPMNVAALPQWYRDPATLTDPERAYVAAFTKRILRSEDAAERIRTLVRQEIVPLATTREEAVQALCRLMNLAPFTAMNYLRGLRLIQLRYRSQNKIKMRAVRRTKPAKALRTVMKTQKQERPPIQADDSGFLTADLVQIKAILAAWQMLSPAGRAWVLMGLNKAKGAQ